MKDRGVNFKRFTLAVTLIKILNMKKQISITLFLILIIVCVCPNLKAQLCTSMMNAKVMKPTFIQKEEKKSPSVKIGLGLETYVAGNALGTFYSARFNISKGRSVFGIGPCLQKRSMAFNGVKVSYSRLLSGGLDRYDADELKNIKEEREDLLELRMLCYFQYTNAAQLSYKASRVETITNKESNINFNEFRTSTIEGALCAELDVNLTWLKIRNYMGFTTYYHFDYTTAMYRPKCSPALVFGTGIIIPSF